MKTMSEEKQKTVWISTTGYRIFLELKALLESPKTLDELLEIIKNDYHCKKEISKDTVRFDLNTLKSAGCCFARPTRTNNYKYELIEHPFGLNISEKELELFLELRDNLSAEISLNEVFVLNKLYDKLAALTFDEKIIETVSNTGLLGDVNQNIINEFLNPQIIGKKVQIRYKSPKFGKENIEIIPVKIIYDNKKLYVVAYNSKYKRISYFEASKILKINSISISKEPVPEQTFVVIYEVKDVALKSFELKSYEKIVEQTENKIKVEAEVSNEFMFIQRLFLLGRDFKIISPDLFREKLLNKIKMIQKRYYNA